MTDHSAIQSSFVLERYYEASRAQVFAAFSDQTAKERWFAGPAEWGPMQHEMDFRVGGTEINRGGPVGGPVHLFEGRYHDIVADERIVFSYDMYLDDRRISVSLVTIELISKDEGTRLSFTEHGVFLDGFDDPASREHGSAALLDALGRSLEHQPTP